MIKTDDFKLFTKIVKTRSLSAAARELGLSPASITNRINHLEDHFNCRLLNRSTRSVSLTEQGRVFHQSCLNLIDTLDELHNNLVSTTDELRGQIRISASSDFGRQYVAPAIEAFSLLNSEISISLSLSDDPIDLHRGQVDIAVRLGETPDSSLICRTLTYNNKRVLCASPDYLKKHGTPKTPDELSKHKCLALERNFHIFNRWYFSKDKKVFKTIEIAPGLSTNDGAMLRAWCVEGLGIGLKSWWDVKEDIKEKRLKVVLENYIVDYTSTENETKEIKLMYLSRKFQPNRITQFIEFFCQYLKDK